MPIGTQVTVVIPTKDAGDKIEKCLEAVFNQTIHPYEIIVVDGHSKDDTVSKARKFNAKIIYEEHKTVGGARKKGVENSNGQYVAFTDSDCIPKKDWLENLLKEFAKPIVGVGGATANIGKGIWRESISLALNSFFGSANSVQDRVLPEKKYVTGISGCNSIFRRSDLIKIGNFNETLRMNEDTEICKRLLSVGKILYTPNAIVFHNQNRGVTSFANRMYMFGKGRAQNKLFDIQVIPPLLAIITVVLLLINSPLFFLMIGIYCSLLLMFTLRIVMKEKQIKYMFSVPFVFIIEHIFYTFGFWHGVIKALIYGLKTQMGTNNEKSLDDSI